MPKYCQIIVEQLAREHGMHSDSAATETQIEGLVKDAVTEFWLYGPEELKLLLDVFPDCIYTKFIEPFMPKKMLRCSSLLRTSFSFEAHPLTVWEPTSPEGWAKANIHNPFNIVREEHTAKRSEVDEYEWAKSLNKLASTTLWKLDSAVERR